MAGDPLTFFNGLMDEMFLVELRRGWREFRYRDDEAEMALLLEEQSAAAGGQAQDEYEEDLFYEARAIVNGVSKAPPTAEHLRVLLERLDSATPAQANGEAPF